MTDVPTDLGEIVVIASKRHPAGRRIGDIRAGVTIEESGEDTLTITQHPVERGAAITDHAYKNPATVSLRLGWSNASLGGAISEITSLLSGKGLSNFINEMYQKLLELQSKRVPFDIVTGKRTYKNMLVESLSVTTDQESENALFVTLGAREIILVQTATTDTAPADVQADPAKTAGVANTGTKQTAPAPQANRLSVEAAQ